MIPLPPAPPLVRDVGVRSGGVRSGGEGTVEIVRTGEIPLAQARVRTERVRKDGIVVPAPTTGISLHRVRYASTGADGTPASLSGLLMLPANGEPRGLVVECHGTVVSRAAAPSRYVGGVIDPAAKEPESTHPEAEAVALAFAAGGYAVAMPDYPGLGDDPGVHPYPLGAVNAASAIDLIAAVRAARPETRGPLYVAGYSEGGAVAMWTVRRLEERGEPVAAAAPMSGPYDLSGTTMRSFLRGGQGLTGLGEKIFLLGFTAYATRQRRPEIDLRNYFAPSMATYIPYVFEQRIPVPDMARKLVIKSLQLGANGSIIQVITNDFRLAIENGDTSDPFLAEFAAQDAYDWTPRTKMLLPYLGNDGIVVPENTTVTLAAMRRRGVGPEVVRGYGIPPRRGRNHVTAAGPALAAARRFFDGGFAAFGDEFAPGIVRASVRFRDRDVASADRTVRLRLVDRTDPRRPLPVAEAIGTLDAGETPVDFRLEYERARLLPVGRYELRAEIGPEEAPTYEASRRFTGREKDRVELRLSRARPPAAKANPAASIRG